MDTMQNYKSFWRRTTLHAIVWLSAATGALALSGGLWFWWLSIPPITQIPTPILPTPNGYNALVRVCDSEVQRLQVDEATIKLYGEHARFLTFTLREKDALIAANGPTLTALRAALKLPFYNPPMRSGKLPPDMVEFRALARLLNLDAQVKEAHGDYHGATVSRLDIVALGVTIPRGGMLLPALDGIACESLGENPLWQDIDHLDVDQATQAARCLEALNARRISYADTQQEEKWFGQAQLLEMFRNDNTFALMKILDYGSSDEAPDFHSSYTRFKSLGTMLLRSKRRIFLDYSATQDAYIAQASRPYRAHQPAIAIPVDPLNQLLFPEYSDAQLIASATQMDSNLLTTAFALRAYRLRQGHYPASLDELVTTRILRRVPSDPFAFAFHVPLRYRTLSANKYLLYSVGPDGKDDGGRPIVMSGNRVTSPDRSPAPQQDDRGDWVVGVNIGAR